MFYTVSEIADLTSLSKVTIYNKLKLSEMESHITKKQGVTYIDDDGLKLIKEGLSDTLKEGLNSFKEDKTVVNDLKEDAGGQHETLENSDVADNKEDLTFKVDYINHLKAENERLWEELIEKNNQINTLSRLVENGQVLLKDKQQPDVALLEGHCDEVDAKVEDVKERMAERRAERKNEAVESGFLKRLFGKKSK